MKIDVPLPAVQHWDRMPARRLFARVRRDPRADDEIVTAFRDGQVTRRSNRRTEGFTNAVQEIGYQGVRAGDLVIHSMDGFAGAIGVSDSDGKASPVVHCYQPELGTEPRFYAYLLRDLSERGFITSLAKGIRERSTAFDVETFRSLFLPAPPLAEQRAIADYLDAETARIEALIAKKQQLVHLLEERFVDARERLLTQPPHHDLVPSRTDFFEAIPSSWGETTLRHLGVEVQTGPFGSQLHAEEYVEGGWPVVNPANIREGRIRRIGEMTVSDDKRSELERHILENGDIVFGRRGEMGRAGLVGDEQVGWLCGTGSLRLRITSELLLPEYLSELLQTRALRNYFLLMSVGSTMDNLNSEIVLSMPCVVPARTEQVALVGELRSVRSAIDSAIDKLQRQIELLAERRQALITAAVTGEFAVPGAA